MTGTPRRGWKLWHLAALVAAVALIMALAVQDPWLLLVLGLFAPPYWAASALVWFFRRFRHSSLPPPTRLTTFVSRMAWFFIFCYPYCLFLALVYNALYGE